MLFRSASGVRRVVQESPLAGPNFVVSQGLENPGNIPRATLQRSWCAGHGGCPKRVTATTQPFDLFGRGDRLATVGKDFRFYLHLTTDPRRNDLPMCDIGRGQAPCATEARCVHFRPARGPDVLCLYPAPSRHALRRRALVPGCSCDQDSV